MLGGWRNHDAEKGVPKRVRRGLVVGAFLLTAVAVFLLMRWWNPDARTAYTATAHVVQPLEQHPTAEEIERALLDPEQITVALRTLAERNAASQVGVPDQADGEGPEPLPSPRCREIRAALKIESSASDESGHWRTSVTLEHPLRQTVLTLVNYMAEQYAEQAREALIQRETVHISAPEPPGTAQTASERQRLSEARTTLLARETALASARTKLNEAVAARESLLSASGLPDDSASIGAVPAVSDASGMVENPEWVALLLEATRLTGKRMELMRERTELHPAVQRVEQQIASIDDRMASIPTMIPAEQAAKIESTRIEAGAASDESTLPGSAWNVAVLRRDVQARETAVETARADFDALRATIRQRTSSADAVPAQATSDPTIATTDLLAGEVIVELAQQCEPVLLFGPLLRTVVESCLAGLLASGVVGFLFRFIRIDTPLRTTPEIERLLGIPVLGTVPKPK